MRLSELLSVSVGNIVIKKFEDGVFVDKFTGPSVGVPFELLSENVHSVNAHFNELVIRLS